MNQDDFIFTMDSFEQRLTEEMEFWQTQIETAERRKDQEVLPRLRDALKLVEFKLERYRCQGALASPSLQ